MDSHAQAQARVEELTASLDKQTGAITGNTRTTVANALTKQGMFGSDSAVDLARQLGLSLDTVTDAALGTAGATEQLKRQLGDTADLSGENVDNWLAWGALQDKIGKASGEVKNAQQRWQDMRVIMGDSAAATSEYGSAADSAATNTKDMGDAAGDAGIKIDNLRSALSTVLDKFQSVPVATAAVKESLSGLTRELVAANAGYITHHGGLDLNTKTGRELQQVIIDVTQRTAELSDATYKQTGSAAKAKAAWDSGVRGLVNQLVKMGLTRAAAKKLADAYGAIPNTVKTIFSAYGVAQVKAGLRDIYSYMTRINGKKVQVNITQNRSGGAQFQNVEIDKNGKRHQLQRGMASGGLIPYGLGGPTQDNVTAPVSSGEYITDAGNTRKWRLLLEAINSGSTSMVRTVARQVAGSQGPTQVARAAPRASRPDYEPPAGGGGGSGAGKVTIVDADGRLIGAMRTASQRTVQQRDAADRLGRLGGWGNDQL
jgi:DNA-directed RNA polymerase subunit F